MGPWYVIYFGVLIFFGPFYLVNLVLAVVAASYESEVQAAKKVSFVTLLLLLTEYKAHTSCPSMMALTVVAFYINPTT